MNAPTETKSPCEKFSVFVVVKVMLKPRAINAYALSDRQSTNNRLQ